MWGTWFSSLFAKPRGGCQPSGEKFKIFNSPDCWISFYSLGSESAAVGLTIPAADDLISSVKMFARNGSKYEHAFSIYLHTHYHAQSYMQASLGELMSIQQLNQV